MSSGGMHPCKREDSYVVQGRFHEVSRPKSWRVIHACEYARDVLAVVEGQVSAGMRPYIVTPQGAGSAELYLTGRRQDQPRSLSLLRSWQDVRNWRKSILDCDPENSADIVHAHCFAAGMAAVRSLGGVVYDLGACIEELATSAGQCEPGSWMGRSFRVAEQFVISRAAAVIVHSLGTKDAALERGALPESIFLIPDPLPFEEENAASAETAQHDCLRDRLRLPAGHVTFLVPQFSGGAENELAPEQTAILESLVLAADDSARIRFLLGDAGNERLRKSIDDCAVRLGIANRILFIDPQDSTAAWEVADVILAAGTPPPDPVVARRANEICLQAMWRGKALLAADLPRNRDASPDGRGCLWFEAGNPRDLAFRLAFLARNPEFRNALGGAGRFHLLETRNSKAIGQKYDEAYRYAFNRKRATGPGTGMASLQPAANWG